MAHEHDEIHELPLAERCERPCKRRVAHEPRLEQVLDELEGPKLGGSDRTSPRWSPRATPHHGVTALAARTVIVVAKDAGAERLEHALRVLVANCRAARDEPLGLR